MIEVSAISLEELLVLLESGECIPITRMVDIDGDETDDIDFAIAVVAGPTSDGQWLTIDLTGFEEVGNIH